MAGDTAVEMSFMWCDAGPRLESVPRSYGKLGHKVQRFAAALAIAGLAFGWIADAASAAERTIKLVALGDSLTAGYQLHLAKPMEPSELVSTVVRLASESGGTPFASN